MIYQRPESFLSVVLQCPCIINIIISTLLLGVDLMREVWKKLCMFSCQSEPFREPAGDKGSHHCVIFWTFLAGEYCYAWGKAYGRMWRVGRDHPAEEANDCCQNQRDKGKAQRFSEAKAELTLQMSRCHPEDSSLNLDHESKKKWGFREGSKEAMFGLVIWIP